MNYRTDMIRGGIAENSTFFWLNGFSASKDNITVFWKLGEHTVLVLTYENQ